MSSDKIFQEQSYQRHANYYPSLHNSNGEETNLDNVFNSSSVDKWRHVRMYQMINPLIEASDKATWLTVGDGRFGKDAKYLLDKGADVHASDISDALLKKSHEAGYLPKYSEENAEALSFKDCHFDYTLCKESYHHFPRPMVAVYEMLRVSKKGIFLIEPNDIYVDSGCLARVFWNCKNILKLFLGKPLKKKHNFEEVGNYLFSVSQREIEKVAMGLNLKYVAFKYMNDVYLPGAGSEPMSDNGPFLKRFNRLITINNTLCKLGFMQYNIIGAAILKEEPSEILKEKLAIQGFELIKLPDNPYV